MCVCVYAHIYTYRCIYVHIHIYNCMYTYVHTYKHICIFICVFIHTHIHIHKHIFCYTLIHRPSCSNFTLKVNVNINETDVGKIPAGEAESFHQRNTVSSLSFFFVPSHHLSIPVLSPYLHLPGRPPSVFPLQSPAPLSFIRSLHGGRELLHKPVGSLVILRLPRRTDAL